LAMGGEDHLRAEGGSSERSDLRTRKPEGGNRERKAAVNCAAAKVNFCVTPKRILKRRKLKKMF